MTTTLEKQLKRQVTIDGVDYVVAIDPEAVRLTMKGKRRPEVELHWRDLLSGEAALAVALNASLAAPKPTEQANAEHLDRKAEGRAKQRPR